MTPGGLNEPNPTLEDETAKSVSKEDQARVISQNGVTSKNGAQNVIMGKRPKLIHTDMKTEDMGQNLVTGRQMLMFMEANRVKKIHGRAETAPPPGSLGINCEAPGIKDPKTVYLLNNKSPKIMKIQ